MTIGARGWVFRASAVRSGAVDDGGRPVMRLTISVLQGGQAETRRLSDGAGSRYVRVRGVRRPLTSPARWASDLGGRPGEPLRTPQRRP